MQLAPSTSRGGLARGSMAKGFTLIEIMVAVSIFAVVSIIAISALVTAHNLNKRAQAVKLVMDNLNFALSSMTLKLKQGGRYYCLEDAISDAGEHNFTASGRDCNDSDIGGAGIAFKVEAASVDEEDRYFIYQFNGGRLEFSQSNPDNANDQLPFVTITAPEVNIGDGHFFVMGSTDGNFNSPHVAVSIYGEAVAGTRRSAFAIQTTIADRN